MNILRFHVVLAFLAFVPASSYARSGEQQKDFYAQPRSAAIVSLGNRTAEMCGKLDSSSLDDKDLYFIDTMDVQLLEGKGNKIFTRLNEHKTLGTVGDLQCWHGENGCASLNICKSRKPNSKSNDARHRIYGTMSDGDEVFRIKTDSHGVLQVTGQKASDFPQDNPSSLFGTDGNDIIHEDESKDEDSVRHRSSNHQQRIRQSLSENQKTESRYNRSDQPNNKWKDSSDISRSPPPRHIPDRRVSETATENLIILDEQELHQGQPDALNRFVPENTYPRDLQVTDGYTVLNIMVVWSKNAECKNSDLDQSCTLDTTTYNDMLGLIDLAVYETNSAFESSGIDVTLNIVHAYRHPDYTEANQDAFGETLDDMSGNMADLSHKREVYGAHLVVMLIDDPQYCGLGYIGPNKSRGFSVVSWKCATGYYSFGHEISHNLGCNHDRGSKSICDASGSSFNYGYRDPNAEFRSIMAYNCRTGQCDNNKGGGCPRVQRFSNTNHEYAGKSIGDESNDNARQINNVKEAVAAWYPTGGNGCEKDSDCNDGNPCKLHSCDKQRASAGTCAYVDTCNLVCSPNSNKGLFILDMTFDENPEDISWTLENSKSRDIVLSGGSYTGKGEHVIIVDCLPNTKYVFTITDSYGDGLCCKWGTGSVRAQWKGTDIVEGNNFASVLTKSFGENNTSEILKTRLSRFRKREDKPRLDPGKNAPWNDPQRNRLRHQRKV